MVIVVATLGPACGQAGMERILLGMLLLIFPGVQDAGRQNVSSSMATAEHSKARLHFCLSPVIFQHWPCSCRLRQYSIWMCLTSTRQQRQLQQELGCKQAGVTKLHLLHIVLLSIAISWCITRFTFKSCNCSEPAMGSCESYSISMMLCAEHACWWVLQRWLFIFCLPACVSNSALLWVGRHLHVQGLTAELHWRSVERMYRTV